MIRQVPPTVRPNASSSAASEETHHARIVGSAIDPNKQIEYGFGYIMNKIPIYPRFYLLKADYSCWRVVTEGVDLLRLQEELQLGFRV